MQEQLATATSSPREEEQVEPPTELLDTEGEPTENSSGREDCDETNDS